MTQNARLSSVISSLNLNLTLNFSTLSIPLTMILPLLTKSTWTYLFVDDCQSLDSLTPLRRNFSSLITENLLKYRTLLLLPLTLLLLFSAELHVVLSLLFHCMRACTYVRLCLLVNKQVTQIELVTVILLFSTLLSLPRLYTIYHCDDDDEIAYFTVRWKTTLCSKKEEKKSP